MFLLAVYYFVGMSKLDEGRRNGLIKELENHNNLKTIKEFFSRFQNSSDGKYRTQVAAILATNTYEEMAPKFMELFTSIREAKDWKSLTCYCDDLDPINESFFGKQVITSLREICGFGDISYKVMERIVSHKGCGVNNFFQDQELLDIVRLDILGLSVIDIVTSICKSVILSHGENLAFNRNHQNLFGSVKSLLSLKYIPQLNRYGKEQGKNRAYYINNVFGVKNIVVDSPFKPYLHKAYIMLSAVNIVMAGLLTLQCLSLYSTTKLFKLINNSGVARYIVQSENIPLTIVYIFIIPLPIVCFEILSPIVLFSGSSLFAHEKAEKVIFSAPPPVGDNSTNFTYNKVCQLGKEAIALIALFYFTNLNCNSLTSLYEELSKAKLPYTGQLAIGALTYSILGISVLAIADRYINECYNMYKIPRYIKAGEEDLWGGMAKAVSNLECSAIPPR